MEISHYITISENCREGCYTGCLREFGAKLHTEDGLNLQDEWECGLAEITFNCPGFLPIDNQVEVLIFDQDEKDYLKVLSDSKMIIKKGYWKIEDLIASCNKCIDYIYNEYLCDQFKKKYQGNKPVVKLEDNRAVFRVGKARDSNEIFYIRFGNEVGEILGLNDNLITNSAKYTYRFYKELINDGLEIPDSEKIRFIVGIREINFNKFYVTTDIIKDNKFNYGTTNILRVIDLPVDYGVINKTFKNIFYYPVKSNTIKNIKIQMFADQNNFRFFPFNYGYIRVVLHLRKILKIVKIPLEPLTYKEALPGEISSEKETTSAFIPPPPPK